MFVVKIFPNVIILYRGEKGIYLHKAHPFTTSNSLLSNQLIMSKASIDGVGEGVSQCCFQHTLHFLLQPYHMSSNSLQVCVASDRVNQLTSQPPSCCSNSIHLVLKTLEFQ